LYGVIGLRSLGIGGCYLPRASESTSVRDPAPDRRGHAALDIGDHLVVLRDRDVIDIWSLGAPDDGAEARLAFCLRHTNSIDTPIRGSDIARNGSDLASFVASGNKVIEGGLT